MRAQQWGYPNLVDHAVLFQALGYTHILRAASESLRLRDRGRKGKKGEMERGLAIRYSVDWQGGWQWQLNL